MGMEQHKDNASKTYVLKVIMHCQRNGCIQKINDGVREIALSEGVEMADLVTEKAEVIVVGTMDPEKICCLLHELTQKHVKIETQTTVSEGGLCGISSNQERSWPGSGDPGEPKKMAASDPKRPAVAGDVEEPVCAFPAMRVPLVGAFSR